MNEMESVREKILLRVVIYLRLSNEDRDKINKDDDSESIKNQRNMLLDYIEKNTYNNLMKLYKIYSPDIICYNYLISNCFHSSEQSKFIDFSYAT